MHAVKQGRFDLLTRLMLKAVLINYLLLSAQPFVSTTIFSGCGYNRPHYVGLND